MQGCQFISYVSDTPKLDCNYRRTCLEIVGDAMDVVEEVESEEEVVMEEEYNRKYVAAMTARSSLLLADILARRRRSQWTWSHDHLC